MGYQKLSRLEDKRYKKVIVFDTETAPTKILMKKPFMVTGLEYRPYGVDFVEESIEAYMYKGKQYWKALKYTKQKEVIFDFGYTISDKHGNVLKKYSVLVEEIFLNMELMKHAYYFSKYPQYLRMLSEGKIKLKPWRNIVRDIEDDLEDFHINEMYAYNIAFDYGALKSTNSLLSKRSLSFLKDNNIKLNCIWGMACETILQQKAFKQIANRENWKTPTGNYLTNAEVCYKYLSGQYDFEEKHTALEDSIIESAILGRCFATKRKMSFGIINSPWRLVNNEGA